MPLFQRRELDTAPFVRQSVSADYLGRLAFIGRLLDDEPCRAVAILEVADNYIVRAIGVTDGMPVLIELVTADFELGDVRAPNRPTSSTYEAVLEAIGRHLDRQVAANISIIETASAYHLIGWERGHAGGQLAYVLFEETLDRHSIGRMVAEVRS